MRRSGPSIPGLISLIPLFERAADLIIGARWIRWHFVDRRIYEAPQAPLRGLETGLNRLRRRLASESSWSITTG